MDEAEKCGLGEEECGKRYGEGGGKFFQRVEPLHSLSKSKGKISPEVPFEVLWQGDLIQLTNYSGGLQTVGLYKGARLFLSPCAQLKFLEFHW